MCRIILNLRNETLLDALSLTGIARELDAAGFEIDVRTRFPDLWANNPHLTPLSPDGERVETITLASATQTNAPCGASSLQLWTDWIERKLGVPINVGSIHDEIHISSEEASWMSQVGEIVGDEKPFWILESSANAPAEALQTIVDRFRSRVLFAEAGLSPRAGAALDGAIDLRGRTTLREFIRLVYNAQGIVLSSDFTRRLSAVLKPRDTRLGNRPCLGFETPADLEKLPAGLETSLHLVDHCLHASPAQRADFESVRLRELFSSERFLPFAEFQNRYAGRVCYVVGRGPTTFDYARLRGVADPIFFINDAVSLESEARGETFFFAHDDAQQLWLRRGLKSTAVLPVGGKFWNRFSQAPFQHGGKIVLYRWRESSSDELLAKTREELATAEQLFTHAGTIHSLLHFIWYCGFSKVVFIGCDGINNQHQLDLLGASGGYDARLRNESGTQPWWQYSEIRAMQDKLCRRFGFQVEYLGTPALPPIQQLPSKIPALAHFTWLGGPMPQMMRDNIERFRAIHPDWEVRVWTELPQKMPADLVRAIYATHELCMRADIIRIWLLHEHGGVYLDGDVYALRSFNELRSHENFVGARLHGTLNNAVLASVAGGPAIRRLLDEVRASFARCPSGRKRTSYGPDLLARVHRRAPGLLQILPAHYFYIFQTHGTAVRFLNASPEEQRKMIDVVRDRISDGVEPFAIHTWGIPKESMPGGAGQSSWIKANAVGDALLRRVPNAPQRGMEIGARDGGLSAYWLGHIGGLKLWTVPHNGEAETIREATRFAGERISVLRDAEDWSSVPDASLDWLFVHGNYDATNVTQAAEKKLKPVAFIAFTGENGTSVRVAEQEAGVSFFSSALRNQPAHDLVSS